MIAKKNSNTPLNILVLNNGSSSIKCSLFAFSYFPERFIKPIWNTKIEWKNIREDTRQKLEKELSSQLMGKKVDAIGHRIVHGGKKYKEPVLINEEVKKEIHSLADLAPLHNVADFLGIDVLENLYSGKPQIAVFDTSFHQTIPQAAAIYPGPYRWLEEGIQRYGFHGISFQYCTQRAKELLGAIPHKMLICHLGSGASLCAVLNGKSVDTTMGYTPLEGLMMDTRSGTVDPGILLYLVKNKKQSVDELAVDLYQKSGLLGLSGISSDMRDILKEASHGNLRAKIALDVYLHRLASSMGSMIVSLGGLDVLIFTAGIGENAPFIRKEICKRLAFLGIQLSDREASNEDCDLTATSSKTKILLIHTKEDFEIAKECWKILHRT